MTAQTLTLVHNDLSHTDHASSSSTPTIPVVLICDGFLLRSGLQHILRDTLFAVVEVVSATDLRRLQYCALNTALVIIEATHNTTRVLELIRRVRERSTETRIVALADQFDFGFVRLAHEAGVNGFCVTGSEPEILLKSLEMVMLGESVLPVAILRSFMDAALQDQPVQGGTPEPKLSDLKECKLSAREAQILGCLREGAPNKIIARQFDVTEATVKVHVKAILRKIGVANRTQAAMWASQRLPGKGVSDLNV